MSILEYRNPDFKTILKVAFPMSHCFIFVGVPFVLTILYLLNVFSDYGYLIFAWMFTLMFLSLRTRLAFVSSEMLFKISDMQLDVLSKESHEIFSKNDVQQVVIAKPIIILRIKSSLLSKVVHIVIPSDLEFSQVSSLPFFKGN